jgi:transposase
MRWLNAGVFETMVDDLRVILRLVAGRTAQPSAVVIDSRTVQSRPESGAAAGYDRAKKRKGRKLHLAVDTLGHLLAAPVTAANAQDRTQVAELAEQVQGVTGGQVEVAFVGVRRAIALWVDRLAIEQQRERCHAVAVSGIHDLVEAFHLFLRHCVERTFAAFQNVLMNFDDGSMGSP